METIFLLNQTFCSFCFGKYASLVKQKNRLHHPKSSPSLRIAASVILFCNISMRKAKGDKQHRSKRKQLKHSKASVVIVSRYTDAWDVLETILDDGDDFLA